MLQEETNQNNSLAISLSLFFIFDFLLVVCYREKKIYQRADTDFLNDSLKFVLYIILIFFTSTSPSIVIIPKSHFHTMKCVQILSLIIIVSFPMKPTSFPQTFPQSPIFLIKSPLLKEIKLGFLSPSLSENSYPSDNISNYLRDRKKKYIPAQRNLMLKADS